MRDAVALSARLAAADLFLATRSGTVYRSVNGGVAWSAVGTIPASDVVDLVIRPDGALLLLTASGSIHRSTNLGVAFSGIATITAGNFVGLTVSTGPLGIRYYALTRTGEVYESTDSGSSWSPKGAIAVSRATQICGVASNLYVLTETGDVYRSADAGTSFTAIATLSQVGMRGLVHDGSSLVAASREGHVATSTDGINWTWRGSMNQLTLVALATNEVAQSGVEPVSPPPPFQVSAVYPNPSRGLASFRVRLDAGADIMLTLFDVNGRLAASRRLDHLDAGEHVVTWAPEVAGDGVYFLKLESGAQGATTTPWIILR